MIVCPVLPGPPSFPDWPSVRKKPRGSENAAWMAAQRIVRLKDYAEDYPDLARRLGLDPKTVRTYYRGESGASLEAVATAVRVGGVDAHWLLTGEGLPYQEDVRRAQAAGKDPFVLNALQKAREVVADLERAAGVDAAHDS